MLLLSQWKPARFDEWDSIWFFKLNNSCIIQLYVALSSVILNLNGNLNHVLDFVFSEHFAVVHATAWLSCIEKQFIGEYTVGMS